MADRGCPLEAVPLPAEVRESLAELELELSEGERRGRGAPPGSWPGPSRPGARRAPTPSRPARRGPPPGPRGARGAACAFGRGARAWTGRTVFARAARTASPPEAAGQGSEPGGSPRAL